MYRKAMRTKLGALCVLMVLGNACAKAENPACTPTVTLKNGSQVLQVQVETALTPEEQQKGLMFRTELAAGHGMVFIWPEAQQRYFWMKNTLIPLDMIFAGHGKVLGVIENAIPHDETPRGVEGEADAVLEVNAGYAAQNGIGPGWEMHTTLCPEN